MSGWIKIHRKILKWEWFSEPKTSHLFVYLLLKASHNDYKWRGKEFLPGQFPFGLNKASLETGLSIQNIRTALRKLEGTSSITIETSNQGSVITILNWEEYQMTTSESTNQLTNQLTNDQQTTNKRLTTTKNYNNYKNYKKYKNITPDAVIQKYNEVLSDKLGYCRGIGNRKYLEQFIEASSYLTTIEEWEDVFVKCRESEILTGKNGGWKASMTWLCDYDNVLKVLNGNYDAKKFDINAEADAMEKRLGLKE